MKPELIDRIYECSFVPELWPGVLDELASLTGASGGLLFAVREKVLNWTSSSSLTEVFSSYVNDGWFNRCTRRICLFSQNQPGFLVEHDFWSKDQLDENPIYRDFFRPRGLGWSAGTGLLMPTGDSIVFSVERAYRSGPIESEQVRLLNELRPHLARAALIAARLSLRSAKGTADTLALLGLPALVLSDSGMVIEANDLMASVPDLVQWRAQGRVRLSDDCADQLLRSALAQLERPAQEGVQSFALRGRDGRAELVAHLVPVRRSALDIFGCSCALMILTPVTGRKSPPVELLRSLFDLTVSEARVARGLANGDSLDEIAADAGVTRNTVRSQLRQVLEKIGCTRQAEVTALLSNLVLGPGRASPAP
ncbi:MAG: helix-turn-helix transcriptional regulator [Pseudomonadota bacterium]